MATQIPGMGLAGTRSYSRPTATVYIVAGVTRIVQGEKEMDVLTVLGEHTFKSDAEEQLQKIESTAYLFEMRKKL